MTEQTTATATMGEQAVNAVVSMNASITYLRVFPPTSATTDNFIQTAYESLCELINEQDSIVFAETERDLLFCGKPFSEKEMKKPQIAAFLDLLLKFAVKSITFKQGLEKEEFREFLEILSNKPEDLEQDGGIQQVMEKKELSHILLNKKIYITTDNHGMMPVLPALLTIWTTKHLNYLSKKSVANGIDWQAKTCPLIQSNFRPLTASRRIS